MAFFPMHAAIEIVKLLKWMELLQCFFICNKTSFFNIACTKYESIVQLQLKFNLQHHHELKKRCILAEKKCIGFFLRLK